LVKFVLYGYVTYTRIEYMSNLAVAVRKIGLNVLKNGESSDVPILPYYIMRL